jgi:hypothetical protein
VDSDGALNFVHESIHLLLLFLLFVEYLLIGHNAHSVLSSFKQSLKHRRIKPTINLRFAFNLRVARFLQYSDSFSV